MSRKREQPENRFARLVIPTAYQKQHELSGFERAVGQRIDEWSRGLYFTLIWTDLGLEWHWYEQTWIFRGTREWWLRYVPYFWRSGSEFLSFEKSFIKAATKRGTMSQKTFAEMGRSKKAELNLAAIQGPLLSAVGAGAGAAAVVANAMSKTNDVSGLLDRYKCLNQRDGYEDACAAVLSGWVQSRGAKAISK